MKNWNNMKTYGMDEEGYLVVDTPLKNKVLEWIKQNRDYETHFVIYTNLEGKTTLKVEKPTSGSSRCVKYCKKYKKYWWS